MSPAIQYMIARAAIQGYCAATEVDSVLDLEVALWPQEIGSIYVPLDIFRTAARDVLHEMNERESREVLTNEECAALLALARKSS